MKKEFIEYLNSVGVTGALQERAEQVYSFYANFLNWDVQDIFVTEYLEEKGERVFENLWFFSNDMVMEAKSFATEDVWDAVRIKEKIHYFELKKTDFFIEGEAFTSESRLIISFSVDRFSSSNLKASKENCIYLAKIFLKYVIPNFVK